MSEYIEVGQSLQFTDPNTPTRVGEIVESVSDIYNIPSPRLGMQVFVKSEKKSFVITSLKSKVINGVDVPEAAVEAFEPVGAKSITWNNDTIPSNMNDFTIAGVYDIKGERTRVNDNLPILNTGGGHSFNARLTVLDSSISGSGKDDDKCITQVLSFSNRLGQGEVYIRTGKGSTLDNLTWDKWSTLQRNVNVEQVDNLDNLKDNGIYSGVWTKGSYNAYPLTFVCVVINDYFIGTAPRRISQFVYGLSKFDGSVVYQSRVWDDSKDKWGDWEILNQKEISSMIKSSVDNAIKGIIADAPEAFDTLKEIADWIANDETGAVALANAISANTKAINTEATRAKEAEEEISQNAIAADTIGYSTTTTDVSLEFETLNGKSSGSVTFPSATTEKAGVMTAEDKKNLDNVPSTIEDAIAKESKATDEKIAKEKDALVNGDTIVGQAREIHSRNGKNVTDSFLARTTAGSGTIGDGVASLKSVGGNIVKNIVSSINEAISGVIIQNDTNLVTTILPNNNGRLQIAGGAIIPAIESNITIKGHIYYNSCMIQSVEPDKVVFGAAQNGFGYIATQSTVSLTTSWQRVSFIRKSTSSTGIYHYTLGIKGTTTNPLYAKNFLCIDLTEMFGETKANQITKEECDKLFGTMDALPQGLSFAKPTEFKSTGFNQFNPDNVLEGKAIANNAIVSGDKKIAVIPCLPCKVGVGENNGYCIHGDFGEDIKVYLTPLNPRVVDGELYMHELTKDATTDTYVPLIKGYMLVEVPTTANLCAHFLWSEDKCDRDSYEPYFESKIELPTIPQMSEYGLAGIQSSGNLVCDEIDFERGVYVKRIGSVDLGSVSWYYSTNAQRFDITISGRKYADRNVLLEGYTTIPLSGSENYKSSKVVFGNTVNDHIFIYDTAYTDAASFKAAMQGVMLYYELATPEEYPLPKVDNNYISSDYGVEQFDSVVPCNANNLYYMRSLAGETRNFLDRLYHNTDKTDANEVADYITNGIEDNKQLALRALFVAAGAEYNDSGVDKSKTAPWGETVTHKARHYYLNGLGDITEEEMARIYNAGKLVKQNYYNYKNLNIKTTLNVPFSGGEANGIDLSGAYSSSMVQIIGINSISVYDTLFYPSNLSSAFSGCTSLRRIIPTLKLMFCNNANYYRNTFYNCKALEYVKLEDLKHSVSFAQSPLISQESILFLINKATPTSAITITLHHDAYVRLTSNTEVVTALSEKNASLAGTNGKISFVCATHSDEIIPNA